MEAAQFRIIDVFSKNKFTETFYHFGKYNKD